MADGHRFGSLLIAPVEISREFDGDFAREILGKHFLKYWATSERKPARRDC